MMLRIGMIRKGIAFVGVIASVLFFLYPLYELLQNQNQVHIIVQIIFIIFIILLIIGSIQTGKKIAYRVHDLNLVKREKQSRKVFSPFLGFFICTLCSS